MRPSATQIINGIRWSFENHIAPKLEDKQSQSMARSIVGLLDHLEVRVANEGRLLAEDNADKRALFLGLLSVLGTASEFNRIEGALSSLRQALEKQYRAADAYPTVESLTEESEDLKAVLTNLIQALQDHRATLPVQAFAEADQAIRAQLARQLDRQDTLVLPFGKSRVY